MEIYFVRFGYGFFSSFCCGAHPLLQYVRYIQWFINAPLVLLALLVFTWMSTPQILTILFFSWFLVINGLVGALVRSSYKWGFFTFGLFGLFFIWYVSIAARVVASLTFPSPGTSCLATSTSSPSDTLNPKRATLWAPRGFRSSGCCTPSVGVCRRVATKSRHQRRWCFTGSLI